MYDSGGLKFQGAPKRLMFEEFGLGVLCQGFRPLKRGALQILYYSLPLMYNVWFSLKKLRKIRYCIWTIEQSVIEMQIHFLRLTCRTWNWNTFLLNFISSPEKINFTSLKNLWYRRKIRKNWKCFIILRCNVDKN